MVAKAEIRRYDEGARRFYERACAADQAGRLTITLAADEAKALAVSIWALIDAVGMPA